MEGQLSARYLVLTTCIASTLLLGSLVCKPAHQPERTVHSKFGLGVALHPSPTSSSRLHNRPNVLSTHSNHPHFRPRHQRPGTVGSTTPNVNAQRSQPPSTILQSYFGDSIVLPAVLECGGITIAPLHSLARQGINSITARVAEINPDGSHHSRPLVAKLVAPHLRESDMAAFEREIATVRHLAALGVPNTVHAVADCTVGDVRVMVMDFAQGRPIDGALAHTDYSVEERLVVNILHTAIAMVGAGVVNPDQIHNIRYSGSEVTFLDMGLAYRLHDEMSSAEKGAIVAHFLSQFFALIPERQYRTVDGILENMLELHSGLDDAGRAAVWVAWQSYKGISV